MVSRENVTTPSRSRSFMRIPIVRTTARPTYRAALAFSAAVALLATGCALAGKSKPHGIDEMIAGAKTAADHEAIAARYDDEAASARAKSEMHERMAVSYRNIGGRGIAKAHMDAHCESLAKIYEQAAKENAALADGHREMAK